MPIGHFQHARLHTALHACQPAKLRSSSIKVRLRFSSGCRINFWKPFNSRIGLQSVLRRFYIKPYNLLTHVLSDIFHCDRNHVTGNCQV